MQRQYGCLGGLLVLVGLSVGAIPGSADANSTPTRSVRPRVVATVTALEPRGLARIQTVEGAIYEVLAGPHWRVGDPVTCEHTDRTRVPWLKLDCRKDA